MRDDENVIDEARAVYQRFRATFGGKLDAAPGARRKRRTPGVGESVPFGSGRDPGTVGDALAGLTRSMGWERSLAQVDLVSAWNEIAGPETAEHSTPTGVVDGVLQVDCDATAWATQLRLMRTEIVTRILQRYPDAGISSVTFNGPGTPSWKRGPRSVPGRGPRDTYG